VGLSADLTEQPNMRYRLSVLKLGATGGADLALADRASDLEDRRPMKRRREMSDGKKRPIH